MRILAVIFSPPFGAIHDIFMKMVEGLSSNNHLSILCPENFQLDGTDNDRNSFGKIYKINYDQKNLLSLVSLRSYQLIQEIREDEFDVVFLFSQHILNIPISLMFRNTNQVMWWHEPNKKGRTTLLKYLLYIPHDYLLTKQAKKIVLACEAMKVLVPKHLQEKISVVPFPSSLLDVSLAKQVRIEPEVNTKDFLFFGKIEAYKGLSVLAESLQILYDRGYKPTLKILGMGDMQKHCPQMLELAEVYPESIEIVNSFASEEQIVSAMSQYKIVVLPYLTATGTTTVQIAYEQHVPVIATQTGCFQNHIIDGQTGWLVPPADALALAEALQKVLDRPEQTQIMGESAYQYFADNFTKEAVTRSLMETFNECLNK
jgi:glycosyltransferase involved in cell wall biosynthesis